MVGLWFAISVLFLWFFVFESGTQVQRAHVIWFNDFEDSSILPWTLTLVAVHFSEYDSIGF